MPQRRQIRSEAWYTAYANALTNLGWVAQESTRRRFDREHTGLKVHEAVIEFIGSLGVGGPALVIITAALKAMQKVDDSKPWITLFDRETRSEDITGFQIGLVEQKAESDFQVKLVTTRLPLRGPIRRCCLPTSPRPACTWIRPAALSPWPTPCCRTRCRR